MLQKFLSEAGKREWMLRGAVVLGLLGLALILLSSFTGRDKTQEETAQPLPETASDAEAYRMEMQEHLTVILESISGVGRAEVLVTLAGSEEVRFAQEDDRQVSGDTLRTSNSYVTVGGSAKEALVESVSHPEIVGVVVACEGGAGSTVQEAVYRAVSVACGIPSNQIFVTKLEVRG